MPLGDFSEQATAYQRSRPVYPAAMIDLLVEDAKVAPGDPVADFGAGTGILTRMLVERGFSVTAIEPNESMRHEANVPEAQWIAGTFEDSTLPDASYKWAVAAQAFHWANPPRSLPEIRRVLQPSSLFTILWNQRSTADSDVLRWTHEAIQRHVPRFVEAYQNTHWAEVLESTGDFTFLCQRVVHHIIRMSRARFLDLWRSHNRLNTLAGPQRFAAFLDALTEYLDRENREFVDVPYRCEAWSAQRKD